MSSPTTTTYGKLKPDIKAAWLTALRSGNYKQGQNYLHTVDLNGDGGGDSFCCLGVLCELAVNHGVVDVNYDPYVNYGPYGPEMPPTVVIDWAYVDRSYDTWVVEYEGERVPLASLNDEQDLTFAEIADLIEASL